jgi:hypothetical protein
MISFTTILVSLVFAIGTALTFWGLGHMEWPGALPVSFSAFLNNTEILFVCTLAVVLGAKWGRRNPIVVGGVIVVGFSLLVGAIWPLLVTLWFTIASTILGRAILSAFRIKNNNINWTVNFLVGAGAYGTAVGLLAHYPVNYPGAYGAMLALPMILGWRLLLELIESICKVFTHSNPPGERIVWLEVSIVVVALIHFTTALMPEVGHDALAMHLFIPAHLSLRHQWGFDVSTYVWAVMPMLGDWIFAIGYMLAGETAARLINVGFIFVLGWLVRALIMWGGGTAVGARWAVLIFLSTPLTFTESSSLFIESVWASFVVAGTLALLRTCSSNDNQKIDLPIAGILLGCALAAKAVTLTILPVLLLLLIGRYKSWLRAESGRGLMIGLGFFVALGLIPYVTSYWLTGNPVFPFYNKLFQSPYYPIVNFAGPPIFGKGVTWDLLYQATFHSGKYLEGRSGAAGFQWLLLFVPAVVALSVGWQRRGLTLVLIGVFYVVLTFQSLSYLRYIFPSFAILSAVVGLAFSGMWAAQPLLQKFSCIIGCLVVGLNLFFFKAGTYYGDFELKSVFSETERETYLQKRMPIRNAVKVVNRLNMGRTPVAVFSSPLTAGLTADGLYPSWYNHQFQLLINKANTDREVANVLLSKGVDFVILDASWGSAEKRLLIENATEKVSDMGSVTVRTLRKEYLFQTELLKNTSFSLADGWVRTEGAVFTPTGDVIVNVASPVYQIVPVVHGHRYLNTVKAFCKDKSTQGRLQVNWLNSKSQFVSTDIRPFDCSSSLVEHSMEVVAPPEASFAAVYVAGHTLIPLAFKEVSFLQ